MTPLLSSALALALAGLSQSQSTAAPSSPPRVSLGARAALAQPLGHVESGLPSRDVVERAFPLELRAGWRLSPELEVGIQGGWTPAMVASGERGDCQDRGITCSVHLWNVAARVELSRRGPDWVPWTALALGWERLSQRWEMDSGNWEQKRYDGVLAGLEVGVDRPVSRILDLGLFVGVSVGQHRWVSLEGEAPGYAYSDAGAVPQPSLHAWLSLGLRGTFAL